MNKEIKQIQRRTILTFILSLVLLALILTWTITERTNETVRETVSNLITATNRQLQLNINAYLQDVESTAALMFADERYYAFDATDPSITEYSRVQKKGEIASRIVDLGLMKNFSDFGVVYADDSTVGWISQVTQAMFPSGGVYKEFADTVDGAPREEAWSFGHKGNLDRVYYTKRLNENAVLVLSFYTRELENVFEYPEELSEMTLLLVNENDLILFSNNPDEIGLPLPDSIRETVRNETNVSIMTKDTLLTSNSCSNGWRILCTVPLSIVLQDTSQLERYAFVVALITALFSILITFLIFRKVNRPMDTMVTDLSNRAMRDQLTGLLNKNAFGCAVDDCLQKRTGGCGALIMFDMDFFKQINDNLGHARGDSVLTRMGLLLLREFSDTPYIGRLGGDEFALYLPGRGSREELRSSLEKRIPAFFKDFDHEYQEEKKTCPLGVSIGIALDDRTGTRFDELYRRADSALYISKNNGKSRETFAPETR